MKILLVCNAGMSTSMLVSKMLTAAKEKNLDVEILAMPFSQAIRAGKEWDVIMLGPQVRHQLLRLQKDCEGTPIKVIDMRDYGMMNGKAILEDALSLLEDK